MEEDINVSFCLGKCARVRFFEINAVATSVERCGEGNDGCKKSKKSAECRVALRSRGGGLTSHKCQARERNMFIKNTSATYILLHSLARMLLLRIHIMR